MKRLLLLLIPALMSPVSAEAQQTILDVDYASSLTRIHIQRGTLKYVWYTGRSDPKTGRPNMAQSLAAYNKHVSNTPLTPSQTNWLNAWADRNHVFGLRRTYPTTQPSSYGTAFRFTLSVSRRGRTHTSTWDDTSHAKPAWTAAQELQAWCEKTVNHC